MLCSLHKLDFEPTVGSALPLVGFGDDVFSEVLFSGSQEVEVVPLIRAKHAAVFVRGNVPRVVTFDRVYSFANAYLARQFELTHMQTLDTLGKGKLRVQVETQAAMYVEACALTGEPVQSDELFASQVAFSYTVYGGKIVTAI